MFGKFGVGDIVKIKGEENLARIVMPIEEEDGSWTYEVSAVGRTINGVGDKTYTDMGWFHREIKEDRLELA